MKNKYFNHFTYLKKNFFRSSFFSLPSFYHISSYLFYVLSSSVIFSALSLSADAKLYEIEIKSMSHFVIGAEVKVEQKDNEFSQITDSHGKARFELLEDEKIFVKVTKKGYEPKGYLGKSDNISLELKSIKVNLSGKIFADGKLVDQEIILIDLISKKEYVTTSVNGIFSFLVPMMKKHALKVSKEDYAPYYEEFKLYSQNATREIHLKKNETRIVIITKPETKKVLVEGKELIIDQNGFATITLKNFNKDFIKLNIDDTLSERRVDKNRVNILNLN